MPKLAIDVEARFAQAMDGLDALGRKADQQTKAMSASFKAVGVVLAAAFSVAAVKQQLDLFKGTLDQLASLDDAAAKAGTSVERFSEAWLFLRPTGVAIEDLSGAVEALFKGLGKGGKEGEEVTRALKEVGVSAKDAAGNIRDPIVVLEEFAKGLAKFENSANKSALINEVLGKSYAQYIPLLEDLAKKQGETAKISTELAEKSEKLANSLRELSYQGDTLRTNFIALFIDDITKLIERFNALSKFDVGFWSKLLGVIGPNKELGRLNEQLQKAQENLAILNDQNQKLNTGGAGEERRNAEIRKVQERIDVLKKEQFAMSQSVAIEQKYDAALKKSEERGFDPTALARGQVRARNPNAGSGGRASGGAQSPKETELQKISEWLDKQGQQAASLNLTEQTAIKFAEARDRLLKERNFKEIAILDMMEEQSLEMARGLDAEKERLRAAEDREALELRIEEASSRDVQRIKDLAASYIALGDPVQQYLDKLAEIDALEGKHLTSEQATRARDAINDQIAGLNQTQEKVEEISEFTREAARNMQDSFAEFLFDPFDEGLDGLAKNFERTLRKMLADVVAAKIMETLLGQFAKPNYAGAALQIFTSGISSTNSTGSSLRAQEYDAGVYQPDVSPATSSASVYQTNNFQSDGGSGLSADQMQRMVKNASLAAIAESQSRGGRVRG